MVKKNTVPKVNGDLESRVTLLEGQVGVLEELFRNTKRIIRQKREYTDEERAAIRTRLLAGQEAARKKRENEIAAKATEKTESGKTKRTKKIIGNEKPKDITEPVTQLEIA